jgi:metal iron transporter
LTRKTQALSAKLGCVTGLTLAEMHRTHLPRWLNIFLWLMAEAAIICTDIGQVIGTAIAINLLCPKIPLLGGCALSVFDALFILLFYRPEGKMIVLRTFEWFIAAIVMGVFVCFCVELSKIQADVGHVFKGYLPSRDIFVSQGYATTDLPSPPSYPLLSSPSIPN